MEQEPSTHHPNGYLMEVRGKISFFLLTKGCEEKTLSVKSHSKLEKTVKIKKIYILLVSNNCKLIGE